MHELSIAMSILDIVEEEAERHGGRVAVVHLKLGPLSGVVKGALASAYGLAREGTRFERTELVVEDVPITAFCEACDAERTLASVWDLCCPDCGVPVPEVLTGREMEVTAIEVES